MKKQQARKSCCFFIAISAWVEGVNRLFDALNAASHEFSLYRFRFNKEKFILLSFKCDFAQCVHLKTHCTRKGSETCIP